jgi:hypothetical protein
MMVSRVKNTHRFHVDLLTFIRPGGKTVGMHESIIVTRPPLGLSPREMSLSRFSYEATVQYNELACMCNKQ